MSDPLPQPSSREPDTNWATLRIASGPLAGPAICRLVSILVGRARCPLDRLDDALLVCDAIIEHAPAHFPDGRIGLEVAVSEASLELRLGPLAPSAGESILSDCAIPGIGNIITQVSDRVDVEPAPRSGQGPGDGERLVLGLDFGAARPSGGTVALGQ